MAETLIYIGMVGAGVVGCLCIGFALAWALNEDYWR